MRKEGIKFQVGGNETAPRSHGGSGDDPVERVSMRPTQNTCREADLGSHIEDLNPLLAGHGGKCSNAGFHLGPFPETDFLPDFVKADGADRYVSCSRERRKSRL